MAQPNSRLIVAFLISLLIGFIVSWLIMAVILDTELRLYGFGNLALVALLIAVVLVVVLDAPLKLGTFEWSELPEGLTWAEPTARGSFRLGQMANSLKVSGFIVLVVGAIASFAALIPQVESPAPAAIEISGDLAGPELAALGEEVLRSAESGCLACHGLGQEGLRAPDLAGIGGQAAEREPGKSAEQYLRESLVDPCAFVVEGYDCIMPPTLAQALGPAKVTAVIAYLQSQGGEITVSLSGDEAIAEAPDASGSGAVGVTGSTAEEIFANAAPSCTTCHQLEAVGASGAVGPDLSQVGARLSLDQIRESILLPNAVVAETCPGDVPCPEGVMPQTYGEQLSALQLETLVKFLSEQQ
jgi:cytochrome c553